MPQDVDVDAQLMLRVKQGDDAAFEELVNKYKQPITNLLYRTLGDSAEAEDLAQNVFVQVYKSAHRYRVSARFSTWLYTIARNLCLNEIRRRRRRPAEPLDASTESDEMPAKQYQDPKASGASEALLKDELMRKVREAVRTLPESQRTAILLFEDELSYDQIAEVLKTSVSAVKSLIHRARETLKGQLKPYLKTGAWDSDESK